MNDLIRFDFESNEVRVIDMDGEPWFVGLDIGKVLGYLEPHKAVERHCKYAKILKRDGSSLDSGISPRGVLIIPESDVYRLIMKSHLPEAEKFEAWVVEEVLPSIRKTGSYTVPRPKKPATRPAVMSPIAREFKAALQLAHMFGLEGNQALLAANRAVKNYAGYGDPMEALEITHLVCEVQEKHMTPTGIGKLLGLSAKKINLMLQSAGIIEQYDAGKGRKDWRPTEKGRAFCILKDVGKSHGGGTPVQQPYYLESVLDEIRPFLDAVTVN